MYYTLSAEKAAHFLVKETIHIANSGTGTLDENGDLINEQITNTKEVRTSQYSKSQDGFDFNDAHIKVKDGSYIRLNKMSITIHNPNNSYNKKLTLDYILD